MVTIDCDNGNLVEGISSLEGRRSSESRETSTLDIRKKTMKEGRSCRKKPMFINTVKLNFKKKMKQGNKAIKMLTVVGTFLSTLHLWMLVLLQELSCEEEEETLERNYEWNMES